MSVLEWRKVNLFDCSLLEGSNKLQSVKNTITSLCYNQNIKVFCDDVGFVHVIFRSVAFKELLSFRTNLTGIKLCDITDDDVLVCLYQDASSYMLHLQLFDIKKITKRNGAPCIVSCQLKGNSAATVLRVCTLQNLLCIAIGFQKGDILYHRATVGRELPYNFKQLTTSMRAINGIEFSNKKLFLSMFVSSDAGVFCYTIGENNIVNDSKIVLDGTFSHSECCTINNECSDDPYFTIGRNDAVYCFTNDCRGPCYAIEGKKRCIAWFGNKLVIAMNHTQLNFENCILIVIDIHSKLIVLHKIIQPILNIIVENNSLCYIITTSLDILLLRERDKQSNICSLINRNMYDIALRLLETSNDDTNCMGYINMQFGNYMLMRGDAEEAVKRFIKTIGVTEPYHIIKKLLNSRNNNHNLKNYLEALVQSEYGTEEHNTLLKNCTDHLHLLSSFNERKKESSNKATGNFDEFANIMNTKQSRYDYMHDKTPAELFDWIAENIVAGMNANPEDMIEKLKVLWAEQFNYSFEFVENIIPCLLNYKMYCIKFLEYVKSICENYANKICILILYFHLHMWRNGQKASEEMLELIKSNENLPTKKLITLCHTFSYWPGIMLLYEKGHLQHLCIHYVTKKSNLNLQLSNTLDCSKFDLNAIMDMINMEKNKSDPLSHYVHNILRVMIHEKQYSLLQLLNIISENKTVRITDIREIFNEDHLKTNHILFNQKQICENLQRKLQELRNLIKFYECKPIEYRNNICNICKQQLNLPVMFFACQHSFHKECISTFAKVDKCVICPSNQKSISNSQYFMDKSKKKDLSYDGLLLNVAVYLSNNKFRTHSETNSDPFVDNNEIKEEELHSNIEIKSWPGRFSINKPKMTSKKPKEHFAILSKNPFEDCNDEISNCDSDNSFQYDANLNPFSEL